MSRWLLVPERWRAFWARLQAENIPRLAAFFATCVMSAGLVVYEIEKGRNEAFQTVGDGLWWAIVTLTTTGYGDKYPITTPGRLMASVAMLLGMGVVATVTAKIASVMVEQRIKEARGLSEGTQRTGHLVILGWKPDMPDFVKEVLDLNPELGADRLTLVNVADDVHNTMLRQQFPGLLYVRGDVVDPVALQRANVAHAAKVIILADQAVHHADEEVDARTVMANIAVKSLAPEVYTCAEVLDKKYLEHLQLGHCDEVVLSRQYSRSLLVGATMASGVTHVIHDLLDFGDRKGLFTEPVPGTFVGQTFRQLASHFKQEGQLLVGLLENTGQSLEIKREALREAQKTTNVATLVENLRRVKALQPNRSVLAPPDDHRIGPHTLAVLIGQPKSAAAAR
jgi:voltage-gated potassium channel